MEPLPSLTPLRPRICHAARSFTSAASFSTSSSVWLIALAGVSRRPSTGSGSPQNDWWYWAEEVTRSRPEDTSMMP